MFHSKRRLSTALLAILTLALLIGLIFAATKSFTVPANDEVTVNLNLMVDDRVVVKFTVIGSGEDSGLDFWITCPNATNMALSGNTGYVSYSFICDAEGNYVMHFSNVNWPHAKLVSLDYEIERYILGLPQMLFLALVVCVICVAMVAVYVLMGKHH